MRIGIDVDGVLTDSERWQIEYASKYFYEKDKTVIVNPKGYDTDEIFNISKQEDKELWAKGVWDYVKEPPRKFANEVIAKLQEEGNEIYIITARDGTATYIGTKEKEMQDILIKWLEEYKIPYNKIIFSSEDKLDICLENNIDVMIEDKPKNVNHISTKIPVICYHAAYNELCEGENIIRAYSWYDIYAKIQKIKYKS